MPLIKLGEIVLLSSLDVGIWLHSSQGNGERLTVCLAAKKEIIIYAAIAVR